MGYVKVLFQNDMAGRINYVLNEEKGITVSSNNIIQESNAVSEMKAIQHFHGSETNNEIMQVIQSWNEKDSEKFDKKTFHNFGKQLAEKYFEGHQYLVVTHTDKKTIHNHIMVNPVNYYNGKRISNKKKHFYNLVEINENISKNNGLSLSGDINEKIRKSRLEPKLNKYQHRGKSSFFVSLRDKTDFALMYSRNMEQYQSILKEFNVDSYIKQGSLYLKTDQMRSYNNVTQNSRNKNFMIDNITKRLLLNDKKYLDAELKINLLDEIHKFNKGSIIEYNNAKNIEMYKATDKHIYLKNKPYVTVNDSSYINHANKTSGKTLEYISNIEGKSYIRTLENVGGVKEVSKLIKTCGEYEKKYSSFSYDNKNKKDPQNEFINKLGSIAEFAAKGAYEYYKHDINKKVLSTAGKIVVRAATKSNMFSMMAGPAINITYDIAKGFLKHRDKIKELNAFLSKNEFQSKYSVQKFKRYSKLDLDEDDIIQIRSFAEKTVSSIYRRNKDTISKRVIGVANQHIMKRIGKSDTLIAITEPLLYMAYDLGKGLDLKKGMSYVLLNHESSQIINTILKENKHIKNVSVITSPLINSHIGQAFMQSIKVKKLDIVNINKLVSTLGLNRERGLQL